MDVAEFKLTAHILCLLFEASETSGIRTVKRNKAVGGVANSKHMRGLAGDYIPDDPAGQGGKMIEAARKLHLRAFWDTDHVHLETIG
jgi:hypothetical protein